MTKPADKVGVPVTTLPKKCPHGTEMRLVRKMSGAWWYEADGCEACRADERAKEEANDAEAEALIERIKARKP